MPTGETNGELYYKTDDGVYHKLFEITEFEDDKLFNNPSEDPGTVRFLYNQRMGLSKYIREVQSPGHKE